MADYIYSIGYRVWFSSNTANASIWDYDRVQMQMTTASANSTSIRTDEQIYNDSRYYGANGYVRAPVPASSWTPIPAAGHHDYPALTPEPPDPQVQWELNRRRMITRNRARASRVRSNIAHRKAEALLLSLLTDKQQHDYETCRYFDVPVDDGRVFRIHYGWAENIDVYPSAADIGREVREVWCAHPATDVPTPDNLLAQKLMIEHRLSEFRQIANVSYNGGYRDIVETVATIE